MHRFPYTTNARHPWVIWLLCIMVSTGFGLMVGGEAPSSVRDLTIDGWAIRLWGFGLLVGGGSMLFAIFWRWREIRTAALVEMIACWQIILSSTLYVGAVVYRNRFSPGSFLGTGTVSVFMIPTLWRVYQLWKLAKLLNVETRSGE